MENSIKYIVIALLALTACEKENLLDGYTEKCTCTVRSSYNIELSDEAYSLIFEAHPNIDMDVLINGKIEWAYTNIREFNVKCEDFSIKDNPLFLLRSYFPELNIERGDSLWEALIAVDNPYLNLPWSTSEECILTK